MIQHANSSQYLLPSVFLPPSLKRHNLISFTNLRLGRETSFQMGSRHLSISIKFKTKHGTLVLVVREGEIEPLSIL